MRPDDGVLGSTFKIAAALLVTFHPDDPSIARTDCPQTERRAERELAPSTGEISDGPLDPTQ